MCLVVARKHGGEWETKRSLIHVNLRYSRNISLGDESQIKPRQPGEANRVALTMMPLTLRNEKKRIISIDCVKKLKHLSADLIHLELEGGEKAGARKVCDLEALNCRCRCDARRGEKMLLMWHSRLSYAM